MKSRSSNFRIGVTTLTLLTLSVAGVVSQAQQQGGPPPGGQGGQGGGRGFGGQGGGRIQLVTTPVEVLASELKLTSEQADKIKTIQAAYRKDRDSMMPDGPGGPGGRCQGGGPGGGGQGGRGQGGGPGGGGQGGGPGGGGQGGGPGGGGQDGNQGGAPPDREAMQKLDKTASDKITAVLTDDQKAALPGVIQMLGALQSAGIPPQALGVLKLTSAQKQKAIAISKEMQQAIQAAMQDQDRQAMQDARTKCHDKIQALLTDEQKAALDKFAKDHPRQGGQRGPGGPGGPGGGQGGDGPPPDGNGPPPPAS